MATNFDGRGREYRGPSFKGPIITGIVSLALVALAWLAYSYALNVMDRTAELPRWPRPWTELLCLAIGCAAALVAPGRRALIPVALGVVVLTAADLATDPGPLDPWFGAWIAAVCTVLSAAGYAIARVGIRLARRR
jgi:hypothetical protein